MRKATLAGLIVLTCAAALADELYTIDGKRTKKNVAAVRDGRLIFDDGTEKNVLDVERIVFYDDKPEDAGAQVTVILASGARLVATEITGDGNVATIRLVEGSEVKVDLKAVAGAVFVRNASDARRLYDDLRTIRIRTRPEGFMQLLDSAGDTNPGNIVGLTKSGIRFAHPEDVEDVVDWEFGEIRLFATNPALAEATDFPAPYFVFHLNSGSEIPAASCTVDGDVFAIREIGGTEIRVGSNLISEMLVKNGKVVYLGDLKPLRTIDIPLVYEKLILCKSDGSTFDGVGIEYAGDRGVLETPNGTKIPFRAADVRSISDPMNLFPYRIDRSCSKNPLRIGKKRYRRGIGVHSYSELTYALDKKYATFFVEIGLDIEPAPNGNVTFRIVADGKTVFERRGVTQETKPEPVALDVSAVAEISLIVDYGENHHIGDHANWANARLVLK